jgi:hypothetical protein
MRRIALLAAAALALAACGGTSRSDRGGPHTAVVRVATKGGFAAEAAQGGDVPQVSVYGDGRVIVVGPTTLEFPGPALPNLQEFRVTGDGLGQIIDEARNAGLLDDPPPDYGDAGITDQPTTTVTVRLDGRTRRVNVSALNFSDGVSDAQRENREQLVNFIELVGDSGALLPVVVPHSERRYEPAALAVLARPSDSTEGDPRAWPLGDLAGTDCTVYTAGDLATVLDAARDAREGDPWISAGGTYELAFRPLLPDERSCNDLPN